MKKLMCEICGGSLVMNADNVAECESCGMKYAKEKVAQMIKIDGAVEITKGDAEKERLLKNAETFLQMNDIYNALLVYEELSKTYPDNSDIWKKMLIVIVNYGVCLYHTTYYGQPTIELTNKIRTVVKEIIRIFNAYARISDAKETIEVYANIYYNNLCNGNITTTSYFSIDDLKNFLSEDQIKFITITGQNNAIAVNELNILHEIITGKNNTIDVNTSPFKKDWCKFYFGRIVHYSYQGIIDTEDAYARAEIVANAKQLSERLANEINIRKSNNLCVHCGGTFKGVFNRVCSKCGRPKDY